VRGSQGQLAALASIRPAALSKFLRNSGPLNDQARIRLTMALPKVVGCNLEVSLRTRESLPCRALVVEE
jgi:hypothetical protein